MDEPLIHSKSQSQERGLKDKSKFCRVPLISDSTSGKNDFISLLDILIYCISSNPKNVLKARTSVNLLWERSRLVRSTWYSKDASSMEAIVLFLRFRSCNNSILWKLSRLIDQMKLFARLSRCTLVRSLNTSGDTSVK